MERGEWRPNPLKPRLPRIEKDSLAEETPH